MKVFISYSHDSSAHKAWVARLVHELEVRDIRTIFDQLDLRLGADISMFVEQGIKGADRVLLVCTPSYALKANRQQGGVGYERLIVTSELVQHLDTHKFVCLLRSGDLKRSIPSFCQMRLFIDFTNDARFGPALEELVLDLRFGSVLRFDGVYVKRHMNSDGTLSDVATYLRFHRSGRVTHAIYSGDLNKVVAHGLGEDSLWMADFTVFKGGVSFELQVPTGWTTIGQEEVMVQLGSDLPPYSKRVRNRFARMPTAITAFTCRFHKKGLLVSEKTGPWSRIGTLFAFVPVPSYKSQ
ncbi:MAG TPA: toll/interleukin-1 receptor domain-containing protein [Thermoanaerobaculia bacterium]|nr:toll/interleukin-1 receptor domain-containing protein [Thermoanaerobaculia bacterium]